MARWSVDYIGRGVKHPGTVEAINAVAKAAEEFNILPSRQFKIVVTRTQAAEKRDRES